MADLSDVNTYLAQSVASLLYPSGGSGNSVLGKPAKVYEGWPIAQNLDMDMQAKYTDPIGGVLTDTGVGPITNVSIYPVPGTTKTVFQILDDPYVIVPPVHGLTATVSDDEVTITGTPTQGEYCTLVVDGRLAVSRVGTSVSDLLGQLLADVLPTFPSASVTGNTLTVPGSSEMEARIGAPATLAQVTHRQSDLFMITVWAADPATRSQFASFIDAGLKEVQRITLPDTSQAIVIYNRTAQSDEHQTVAVYRRDLIYSVEYATLEVFTGYEITSVSSTVGPGTLGALPSTPSLNPVS